MMKEFDAAKVQKELESQKQRAKEYKKQYTKKTLQDALVNPLTEDLPETQFVKDFLVETILEFFFEKLDKVWDIEVDMSYDGKQYSQEEITNYVCSNVTDLLELARKAVTNMTTQTQVRPKTELGAKTAPSQRKDRKKEKDKEKEQEANKVAFEWKAPDKSKEEKRSAEVADEATIKHVMDIINAFPELKETLSNCSEDSVKMYAENFGKSTKSFDMASEIVRRLRSEKDKARPKKMELDCEGLSETDVILEEMMKTIFNFY